MDNWVRAVEGVWKVFQKEECKGGVCGNRGRLSTNVWKSAVHSVEVCGDTSLELGAVLLREWWCGEMISVLGCWAVGIAWAVIVVGCSIWRMPEFKELTKQGGSPVPELQLSVEPVRSALGDVLLFVPKGWFLPDLGDRMPAGMVAVAVNPDYTLALTLTLLRRASRDSAGRYDLLEVTRQSFERHQARTAGAVRLASDFTLMQLGMKTFGVYRFVREQRHVWVAVFVSSIGTVYEVAVVPLSVRPIDPPPEDECERIFKGVLRAIQF